MRKDVASGVNGPKGLEHRIPYDPVDLVSLFPQSNLQICIVNQDHHVLNSRTAHPEFTQKITKVR